MEFFEESEDEEFDAEFDKEISLEYNRMMDENAISGKILYI